ncbi:Kelch-type beta propeller [Arabidopsis thaliana x Arabidopsis arenosa]|uniref:Kelch-type beta propeller n=1 Tax=Arabidopsis thaliana x Arabidopsis arenosa TaxID=1240361 RepID=A0A8T2CIA5_9BRAS|nr:Kelch-type beta propeller [Arabidopsis thaliana x Arabidopsis arenosa]
MVSKNFRSLMASPDLEATRTCMGITENYLVVCLDRGKHKDSCRWFTLAPIHKQEKLLPIPSFPYLNPKYSTVLSIGSEIYIIGGDGQKYGKRVLVFDCRSPYQRRRLPKMRVPRRTPAVDVIDGKIYVIGGSISDNIKDWGEVYDPKAQTWEPVLPTTSQMSLVPGNLVMGGSFYSMDTDYQLSFITQFCVIKIDNMLCRIRFYFGKFLWCDLKESWRWTMVKGLQGLPNFEYIIPCSDGRGRSVTGWWKTVVYPSLPGPNWSRPVPITNIWCAEISFKRRCSGMLWGFVEWSKIVFTLDQCDFFPYHFLLQSAIVTY